MAAVETNYNVRFG